MPKHPRSGFLSILVLALVLVLAGCGDDETTSSADETVRSSVATTGTAPAEPSAAGDDSGFCDKLVAQAEGLRTTMASATPETMGQVVADLKAQNEAIVAAAPEEISGAVARVNELSSMSASLLALDDRAAQAKASAEMAEKAAEPATTDAFAQLKAWVQQTCPEATAEKILGAG